MKRDTTKDIFLLQGQFYSWAKDLFYFAQLRSQGDVTTHTRRLDGIVPLSEVANILCALGEHPTNKDIRNISSECRRCLEEHETAEGPHKGEKKEYSGSILTRHGVDFESFLKLYLNHRSNSAPSEDDIQRAFSNLEKYNGGHKLTPRYLESLLATVRTATPQEARVDPSVHWAAKSSLGCFPS